MTELSVQANQLSAEMLRSFPAIFNSCAARRAAASSSFGIVNFDLDGPTLVREETMAVEMLVS